jgi:hypothetical protein
MSSLIGLCGKRILIVERAGVLEPEVRRRLEDNGVHVLGPVARLEEAARLLTAQKVDAAIVNLNIPGSEAALFDDLFESHNLPYLFAQSDAPAAGAKAFCLVEDDEELGAIAMALFAQATLH